MQGAILDAEILGSSLRSVRGDVANKDYSHQKNRFYLHRHAVRQRSHADGGARVASRISQNFDEEI